MALVGSYQLRIQVFDNLYKFDYKFELLCVHVVQKGLLCCIYRCIVCILSKLKSIYIYNGTIVLIIVDILLLMGSLE